ncbi:hypothetical protein GcC1_070021 [Golovinomyces cichoracearum]|uniref:Uncharacterized protein n=1 Tax=Golovinomyces cichoracearum TaxID=62708 RepID=A0A420IPU5_9PEZI|nr:hypothetical protein GcC1_070021 [Golovinomyces cichoracearum]
MISGIYCSQTHISTKQGFEFIQVYISVLASNNWTRKELPHHDPKTAGYANQRQQTCPIASNFNDDEKQLFSPKCSHGKSTST